MQPFQNERAHEETSFRFYGLLPTTYTPYIYILTIAFSIYTRGIHSAVYEFLPLQNRDICRLIFYAVCAPSYTLVTRHVTAAVATLSNNAASLKC